MSDFPIGTKYTPRGRKHARECTVVDVWKTYNSAGELVKTRYVSTHEFAGQQVREIGVVATTISLGLSPT